MDDPQEWFKVSDPRWDVNPYNPYDPATAYGSKLLNQEHGNHPPDSNQTITGWPAILFFVFIIGFMIFVGVWQP